jgi:LacI family transcriptional regulator
MEDSNPSRVRLRDVAAAAGVSHTTVSMAFRNHPSIPPATRERIRKVAEEMGYRPDPEVGKLMERIREKRKRKTGNIIAYITAFPHRDEWRTVYTMLKYYEYAKKRAEECGFNLQEFWLREPGMNARRLSEVIRARGIENIIIAPLPGPVSDQQALFDGFRWSYFSAVALGYSFQANSICRACFNHFDGMTLLMRKLQEMGYRSPGLSMSLSMDERTHHLFRSAYLNEQSFAASADRIPMDISSNWDRGGFERWFKDHQPDVVIAWTSEIYQWMTEEGLKIPRNVGFALIDRPAGAVDLCGIDQQPRLVAFAAVDLLLSLYRLGEKGLQESPRVVMTEGRFIAGKTVQTQAAHQ